jgi:hypothetical protein
MPYESMAIARSLFRDIFDQCAGHSMNDSEAQAPRPEGSQTATPPSGRPAAPPPDDETEENVSLLTEFFWFIRDNKKWWLIPLILIFAALAALIILSANPATAPFIYTLF